MAPLPLPNPEDPKSAIISKTGIVVAYEDLSFQRISFANKTFNLDRGLKVSAGDTTLSGALEVSENGHFKKDLTVDGAFTLGNKIEVTKADGDALVVNGSTKLNGVTAITNTLTVDKHVNLLESLDVGGVAELKSTLNVTDVSRLNSGAVLTNLAADKFALEVIGKSELRNAADLKSTLDVVGASHLLDNLTVDKISNLNDSVIITHIHATEDALVVNGSSNLIGSVAITTGGLNVKDNAVLQSKLTVNAAAELQNTVNLTQRSGDGLIVAGKSNLIGDVKLNSNLTVDGAVGFGNTLSVDGKVTLQDKLDVDKEVLMKDTLTVDGVFTLNGTMSSSALNVSGAASFTGAANLTSALTVSGNTDLLAQLSVAGKSDLKQTVITWNGEGDALTVNGKTKLNGEAKLAQSLDVDGPAKMGSTLEVIGKTDLKAALDVTGKATLIAGLEVAGLSVLQDGADIQKVGSGYALSVAGSTNLIGAANIDSSLDVSGAVWLKSTLQVDKESNLNDIVTITKTGSGNALEVVGTSKFTKASEFSETLKVGGVATMDNTLTVAKISNLNDGAIIQLAAGSAHSNALQVSGASNFGGDATIIGTLNVKSSATLEKALTVNKKATLNDALDVSLGAHLKNKLTVDGSSELNNKVVISVPVGFEDNALEVTGTSLLTGQVQCKDTLIVTGVSTLAKTNITYTSADANGPAALTVTGNAQFNNDVTINGNLTVTGTMTKIDTTNLQVADNAILIADGNDADVVRSGIMVQYKPEGATAVKYAGLRRTPVTGEFVFYKDADAQMGEAAGEGPTGSVGAPADVIADSFNCASDSRLKKNIVPLDGALDKIDNIRGVYHDWIDENWSKERQIGVIAQEVQAIYPELVQLGGNGFLSVNYPKLTAVLLQSIKELKAMVLALA